METLSVKDFLVLKEAKLEVRGLNILVGPQASGKSLLAKLLYFFREFLEGDFQQSVRAFDSRMRLEQRGLERFEELFPPYVWKGRAFNLVYTVGRYEVSVANLDGASIKLAYSPELEDFRAELIDEYKSRVSSTELQRAQEFGRLAEALDWLIETRPEGAEIAHCFRPSQFIPASRSLFAILQKNIFALLEGNVSFDPLMKSFGARLDVARNAINHMDRLLEDRDLSAVRDRGLAIAESVLTGKYLHEDGEDWIVKGGVKTNLSNASSAQQEVLPMLLSVIFWPIALGYKRGAMSFIEEPEAHLFPYAQKEITELFAIIRNRLYHSFFITTHSPYVLTALNNLILARDVAAANPGIEVAGMPGEDALVGYEDVRAYTIEDGVLESVMNNEERLIGASIIDSVSDEFDSVYDALLQVQFGG